MAPGQPSHDWIDQLDSSDETVRLEATQSLGSLPDCEGLLIQMLGDDSWQVRQAAVARLAQSQAPAIAPLLVDLLRQHHHNPGVVDSVLRILMLSSLDATSLLLECATDANTDLRIYAMTALGEQRDLQAFNALMQGLTDADVNVRYHAIEALGRQRNPAAVEALLAIANSHEVFLAFPALDALGKIGDATAATRLLPLLNDDLLTLPTIETLGSLGDATVIPALAHLLDQPHAPVQAIAQAIAQIYHTVRTNGSIRLALAEFLQKHLTAETAQKFIPLVTQLESVSAKPDLMAGLHSEPAFLIRPTDTEAIT